VLPWRIGHSQERQYDQKQKPGTHDRSLLEKRESKILTLTIVVASGRKVNLMFYTYRLPPKGCSELNTLSRANEETILLSNFSHRKNAFKLYPRLFARG
jgi:hypothetical protein